MNKKYTCAVQVDLDSYASLLKFHNCSIGDRDIKNSSQFYVKMAPRFLDLFHRHGIKATFFISGWDIDGNREVMDLIKLIHDKGHEVANHSYHHYYNLTDLDIDSIRSEIEKNALLIERITNRKPVGFKSPGCSVNVPLLDLLAHEGYLYDSSVAPSFFYYLYKCIRNMSDHTSNKSGRSDLFSIFSPTKPYSFTRSFRSISLAKDIVEIPLRCLSVFRFPFYTNTLFLLSSKEMIKQAYHLMSKGPMAFFMHGIDVIDFYADKVDSRLNKHPFIKMPFDKKLKLIESFFDMAKADFVFERSDILAQKILKEELQEKK